MNEWITLGGKGGSTGGKGHSSETNWKLTNGQGCVETRENFEKPEKQQPFKNFLSRICIYNLG